MLEPSKKTVGISGAWNCQNSWSLCVGQVGAHPSSLTYPHRHQQHIFCTNIYHQQSSGRLKHNRLFICWEFLLNLWRFYNYNQNTFVTINSTYTDCFLSIIGVLKLQTPDRIYGCWLRNTNNQPTYCLHTCSTRLNSSYQFCFSFFSKCLTQFQSLKSKKYCK